MMDQINDLNEGKKPKEVSPLGRRKKKEVVKELEQI